jgi:hypothetical protein
MAVMAERTNDLPSSYKAARIGLAALTGLLSVFLWTGAPLLAIWTGAQIQGSTGLTMKAVGVVIGVLAISVTLIVMALVRVEAMYKFFSGAPVDKKRVSPWMRSMRGERPELEEKRPLTGFEKGLVASVVAGGIAFEVWFFFFAGSSIG